MRILLFFVFFMINGLVKSQTQIIFFNEFLLGGENNNYTKTISKNKVASMRRLTTTFNGNISDTSSIEVIEFYRNGIEKGTFDIDYVNNYIFKQKYKYRGAKFLSSNASFQTIEEGDTILLSYSRIYKYKRNLRVRIYTMGDYWNENLRGTDSTVYNYKNNRLISEQKYVEDDLVETVEYFSNQNGYWDSVLRKYFVTPNNLFVDTVLSKTIYYYDEQNRLSTTIFTKAISASNYDTDYSLKWEYKYNDQGLIELKKESQLSGQQENIKLTKIKYLENNQVEILEEKAGFYVEDLKHVYTFSDSKLLLNVKRYIYKKELWELTSEETNEYTYY